MEEFGKALTHNGRNPLIPPERDLFGRLVGEWKFNGEYINEKGGLSYSKGEWIFSWILEGMAIQDVFIWPPRGERVPGTTLGEYGTTFHLYNPDTGNWDVVYVNTGCVLKLEAVPVGNDILLTEVTQGKMRWTFSDITQSSFVWRSVVMNENGEETLLSRLNVYR